MTLAVLVKQQPKLQKDNNKKYKKIQPTNETQKSKQNENKKKKKQHDRHFWKCVTACHPDASVWQKELLLWKKRRKKGGGKKVDFFLTPHIAALTILISSPLVVTDSIQWYIHLQFAFRTTLTSSLQSDMRLRARGCWQNYSLIALKLKFLSFNCIIFCVQVK